MTTAAVMLVLGLGLVLEAQVLVNITGLRLQFQSATTIRGSTKTRTVELRLHVSHRITVSDYH